MPKEYINPTNLFPSLPYGFSQVVTATGRRMVFISGQTAWDTQKNIVGEDSVLEQARQAFRNLATAMEAAGGTLKDVVALRHEADALGHQDVGALVGDVVTVELHRSGPDLDQAEERLQQDGGGSTASPARLSSIVPFMAVARAR